MSSKRGALRHPDGLRPSNRPRSNDDNEEALLEEALRLLLGARDHPTSRRTDALTVLSSHVRNAKDRKSMWDDKRTRMSLLLGMCDALLPGTLAIEESSGPEALCNSLRWEASADMGAAALEGVVAFAEMPGGGLLIWQNEESCSRPPLPGAASGPSMRLFDALCQLAAAHQPVRLREPALTALARIARDVTLPNHQASMRADAALQRALAAGLSGVTSKDRALLVTLADEERSAIQRARRERPWTPERLRESFAVSERDTRPWCELLDVLTVAFREQEWRHLGMEEEPQRLRELRSTALDAIVASVLADPPGSAAHHLKQLADVAGVEMHGNQAELWRQQNVRALLTSCARPSQPTAVRAEALRALAVQTLIEPTSLGPYLRLMLTNPGPSSLSGRASLCGSPTSHVTYGPTRRTCEPRRCSQHQQPKSALCVRQLSWCSRGWLDTTWPCGRTCLPAQCFSRR